MIVGTVSVEVLNWMAGVAFSGLMGISAAIGSLVCWWRPGLDAAGWKLWLMASFANPMMLVAVYFTVDQYDCLIGRSTGWDCMFADLGPMMAAVCLPSPLIGLAVRWRKRRGAEVT
jgi:hypothetical protein